MSLIYPLQSSHFFSNLYNLCQTYSFSENYTEAYLVIISRDPGLERDTCLKALIEVLCEKGQLGTLVQFPYFGILGQVIEILLGKIHLLLFFQ